MAWSVIIRNPGILSGGPDFRGMRVPFQCLTDYLEQERSLTEFLDHFPAVTCDDAIAAL